IAKEEPHAYIVFIFSFAVSGLIAIWVNYSTLRLISYARTQNTYLKNYYIEHWQDKMMNDLHLPRPFGATGVVDKDKSGKPIRRGAGPFGFLFRAIMAMWVIGLAAMIVWAFGFLRQLR